MSTTETKDTGVIPPELMAELEEAARYAACGVRDPEVMRRACERMDRIREEIRQKHGVLDIGVPAIRELRDGGMKYVINSSVGVKWVVPEVDTDKALRLRDDFRNGIHELIAPDVFPTEAAHALVRAERQGRVTPGQGITLLTDLLRTLPQLHAALPDLLPRAFAIASQARIGVYDCLYVALAEREGCELVTADDKLTRSLQAQFSFIVPLASLP